MYRDSKAITIIISTLLIIALLPIRASADFETDLRQGVEALRKISTDVRHRVVPLLSIIEKHEKGQQTTRIETAKMIESSATIYESDTPESASLLEAKLDDEFPILRKRDQWYEIRLEDGRQGWIQEDAVQILVSEETVDIATDQELSQSQIEEMYSLSSTWMDDIEQYHETAAGIFATIQQQYNDLSPSEKKQHEYTYQLLVLENEKIARYHTYADHFFTPYQKQADATIPIILQPDKSPLSGTATLNLGKSSYNSDREESETSQELTFNGMYRLNEKSKLNASLTKRRDVIHTPFSTTNFRLGHTYRQPDGLSLNSRISYDKYSDDNMPENEFGQLGLNINIDYLLQNGTQLFGYFNRVDKNFEQGGGNGYTSNMFNIGATMEKDLEHRMTFNVNGIVQRGDVSYLEFNQFNPRFRYVKQTSEKSNFAIIVDVDRLSYSEAHQGSNYTKENISFQWTQQTEGDQRERLLRITGKQFPNHQSQNYLKLSGDLRWQSGRYGFGSSTSTSIFGVLTVFTNGDSTQANSLDLRLNRTKNSDQTVWNINVYFRFWTMPETDIPMYNTLNLYSRMGWVFDGITVGPITFTRFNVGPVLGGHILYHKETSFFKNEGNALRIGVGCQGNFKVKSTSGNISLSWERSFTYENEIAIVRTNTTYEVEYGDLVQRKPTSFQCRIASRTPITQNLDLQASLSYYTIDTDINEAVSIEVDPIQKRSKFKFWVGLTYRLNP